MKNGLSIDFANNQDLAGIFARKSIGDSYEIKVKGKVKSVDDELFVGTVDTVVVVQEKAKPKEIEPDAETPVSMEVTQEEAEPEDEGEEEEVEPAA